MLGAVLWERLSAAKKTALNQGVTPLKVKHERMGEDGTVSSLFCVDDFSDLMPYMSSEDRHEGAYSDYAFDKIVHLVRHPLRCITSLRVELPPRFWTWQEPWSEVEIADRDAPTLEEVARFWLAWTSIVDRLHPRPSVIRLEDVANLAPRLGQGKRDPKTPWITWEDLARVGLSDRVREQMQRYGYDGSEVSLNVSQTPSR